jgi:hypothetical protein
MALSIRPMQWAKLPELHQTAALDDSDLDCLEEIRGVLSVTRNWRASPCIWRTVISSWRRTKS